MISGSPTYDKAGGIERENNIAAKIKNNIKIGQKLIIYRKY